MIQLFYTRTCSFYMSLYRVSMLYLLFIDIKKLLPVIVVHGFYVCRDMI